MVINDGYWSWLVNMLDNDGYIINDRLLTFIKHYSHPTNAPLMINDYVS